MFRFETHTRGDVTVLGLHGSLDALTSVGFKQEVIAIEEARRRKVVVDLGALEVIDSTGVGVLISLFKRIRALDGRLLFAGLIGQPREVIRVLRLDRSFDIVGSVDEAVGQLTEA